MEPSPLQGDTRISLEQRRVIEVRQPLLDGSDPTVVVGGKRDLRDDRRNTVEVPGCQSMLERRLGIVVPLVPVRGPGMQRDEQVRLAFDELASKQVTEKVVVAMPHP